MCSSGISCANLFGMRSCTNAPCKSFRMRNSEKGAGAGRAFQVLPKPLRSVLVASIEWARPLGLTSHCALSTCRIEFRLNDHELDHELRHPSLAPAERCGQSAE